MRKKIAIFNDFQRPIPPVNGGSVPNLINMLLLENEVQQKFDIDVYVCNNKKAKEQAKSYKHTKFIFVKDAGFIRFMTNLCFKLKLPVDLSEIPFPLSIKRFYKKQNYDMVYIVGYIRGALPIMKISKAPCVVHHHVVTDIINEPSIKGCEIVDKADRICFVSDFARDYARTGTEIQNQKMHTFPNTIDIDRFEQLDAENVKKEIREKYGIKEDDTVILFVGRLVRYKGALELIKAFNNAGFSDDVKLMIVGGETYASTKVTPYVQECLDEAKNNKNIILTGYVAYNDIPKYYYASDISTLLSFVNEAAGLVGIESMAAGLPLITTDRGGIKNYIPEGAKIRVEEGEDFTERVAEAIKLLVSDDKMRNKMSICAENEIKKHGRKNYYNDFCELVEQVVNK